MLVLLQGKGTQMCPMVELYTLFHEQAVCRRDTKWKRAYLMGVINIAKIVFTFP